MGKIKRLKKFTKKELIDLIVAYDNYIFNFFDEEAYDKIPVCLEEFYDNEYQDLEEKIN